MNKLLLFASVLLSTSSWANVTLGSDQAAEAQGGHILVLDAALDAVFQKYFRPIIADVSLPGETPPSRVQLFVSATSSAVAFVNHRRPDVVYWNAAELLETYPGDVDALHMAHEIAHFHQRFDGRREQEYEADLEALINRLFRRGLRDAQGRPEAPRVNVKAVVDYLETVSAPDVYLDPGAIVSGLKVAYAELRMTHDFPKTSRPRLGLAPVVEAIRSFVPPRTLYAAVRSDERTAVYEDVKKGRWVEALAKLDFRRERLSRYPDPAAALRLGAQYTQTMKAILAAIQTASSPEERLALFDRLALIEEDAFTTWRKFLPYTSSTADEVLGPSADSFPHGQRWEITHRFGLDSHDVESGITRGLTDELLSAQSNFVALGVSRLLRNQAHASMHADPNVYPLRTFLSAGMIGLAKSWLGPGTESEVVRAMAKTFDHWRLAPDFGERLADRISFLVEKKGTALLRMNLALLLSKIDLDRTFPGLRESLEKRLPENPRFAVIRFYLQKEVTPAKYVAQLLESDAEELPFLVFDLVTDRVSIGRPYHEVLYEFLKHRVDAGRTGWLPGLGGGVWASTLKFLDLGATTPQEMHNFELSSKFDGDLRRWSRLLTDLAYENPLDFLEKISNESRDVLHPFLMLIDWARVFEKFNRSDMVAFASKGRFVFGDDHFDRTLITRAFANRLTAYLAEFGPKDNRVLLATMTFLATSATTTPEVQRTVDTLVAELRKDESRDGVFFLNHMLKDIPVFNFANPVAFADLYAESVIRLKGFDHPFEETPETEIQDIMGEIHKKYDPRLAAIIGERLRRAFKAAPDQFHLFENRIFGETQKLIGGQEDFWSQLFRNLSREDGLALARAMPTGAKLSSLLRAEVQAALTEQSIFVPARSVEGELRLRYRHVTEEAWERATGSVLNNEHHEAERSDILQTVREKIALGQHTPDLLMDVMDRNVKILQRNRVRNRRLSGDQEKFSSGVAEFHLWYELVKNMNLNQILNILDMLTKGTPLSSDLRQIMAMSLAENKIRVSNSNIEAYLTSNFRTLSPLHRAGVFQLILGANRMLLKLPEFRARVFRETLEQLPDAEVRATFVDLWEAGLSALPEVLRSLILSIVLSESGLVGSPEDALVMVLAHGGPLEQKMGQTLAMSKIPLSYRKALRKLWSAAQDLSWAQAWELILVQKGDIRRAGYRLTRILNSGSTKVYLEVENPTTGHWLVLSVFRDGIANAVETGYADLKKFAAALGKRNPQKYGFLSLLVEDARRTMIKELDSNHRRRMTEIMAGAYRRAALKLGHSVDAEGLMHVGQFRFATISPDFIVLPDGSKIEGEHLAEGESFQRLAETNPALYEELTAKILALEAEVLRNPNEPIDKDRMPGQYIYNAETETLYLLDAGQALEVDSNLKAELKGFMALSFAGDVKGLDRLIQKLTGVDVSASSSGKELWASDMGLRPLNYMTQIAAPFLRAAEGDPARGAYFDLLHGVRATLRLLQWEEDTNLYVLKDLVREDLLMKWNPGRAIKLGAAAVAQRVSTGFLGKVETVGRASISSGIARMEAAYVSCEAGLGDLTE